MASNARFMTPRANTTNEVQPGLQSTPSTTPSTNTPAVAMADIPGPLSRLIPRLNSSTAAGHDAGPQSQARVMARTPQMQPSEALVSPSGPVASGTVTPGPAPTAKRTGNARGRTWLMEETITMLLLWNDKAPPQGSGTGLVHLAGDREKALLRVAVSLRDRNPAWVREPDHIWDKWERLMKDHRKNLKKIASGATVEDPVVQALMDIQRVELDMAPIVENENVPGTEAASAHLVRRQIVEKIEGEKKLKEEKNKKRQIELREKEDDREKKRRMMDTVVKSNAMLLRLLAKHLDIPMSSVEGEALSDVSD
eukprot:GILK01002691.1.p1 GENE.GILK01002691.1~~GILK01002691.1.p1  ORF type:complete len:336 (-),score=24.87 GILK01002691.1:125-1054(-)